MLWVDLFYHSSVKARSTNRRCASVYSEQQGGECPCSGDEFFSISLPVSTEGSQEWHKRASRD